MTNPDTIRMPTWTDWGVALAIFMVGVFGTVAVGKGHAPTRDAALLAAAISALATLATTAWAVRFARYPRWSYWTSALVLSALALSGAALSSDAHLWQEQLRTSLWMNPWFPLVIATSAPGAGACWAGTARGGSLLVGTAAFLGAIPILVQWIF